ncbi:MAG: hypothetical protein L0Z68_02215 [Gammaproteobacteria bacterium]|nr:hypothetical protein [Gammaproteobacteria bacterium]
MKRHLSTLLALLVVGGILGLHLPEAEARGRIRFHGTGLARGAHHSGPVLSREQLRVRVAQQNRVNVDGANLDKAKAGLQAKAAEIESLEANIKRRKPFVDQYSEESVDSFNALIGEHGKLVAAYNSGLPAYNAEVDRYKVGQQAFNTKCAGHAYYESDMQAVLASK